MAIALKASEDTALEEQAALVASFIYNRAPGSLPISFSLFTSLFFVGHGYSHVFVPILFAGGLLLCEINSTVEVQQKP